MENACCGENLLKIANCTSDMKFQAMSFYPHRISYDFNSAVTSVENIKQNALKASSTVEDKRLYSLHSLPVITIFRKW